MQRILLSGAIVWCACGAVFLSACSGSGRSQKDPTPAADLGADDVLRFADSAPADRVGEGGPAGDAGGKEDVSDVCWPDCQGRACGPDGCGATCGVCIGGQEACQDGACVCQPKCGAGECGSDGCGGNCGACGQDEVCVEGLCQCAS
ncbi:MAG: hypothetical protein FJ109_21165, partial [Deltaproteobacteria bacterium]|nr:hypothetical protein [Deltaproteobacteria bacterium]